MKELLSNDLVSVMIGWSETVRYGKRVEMTREEFDAWKARYEGRDRKFTQDIFDKYQLQRVQPNDWDGVEDLDYFSEDR